MRSPGVIAAVIGGSVALSSCAPTSPDPCQIQAVEEAIPRSATVLPSFVQAVPGASFQLRAVLFDKRNHMLPEYLIDPASPTVLWQTGNSVNWTAKTPPNLTPPLSVQAIGPGSHRAIVQIGPSPTAQEVEVTAIAGQVSASTTIQIVPLDAALLEDGIASAHTQGSSPSLAVLDAGGARGPGCTSNDEPFEYVVAGRLGALSQFESSCQAWLGLFDNDHRAVLRRRAFPGPVSPYLDVAATTFQNVQQLVEHVQASPPPPDSVGVILWLPRFVRLGDLIAGVTDTQLEPQAGAVMPAYFAAEASMARAELNLANSILKKNRVGLAFRLVDLRWAAVADWAHLHSAGGDPNATICSTATRDAFWKLMPDSIKDLQVIHVLYLRGEKDSKRGWSCAHDSNLPQAPYSIVFMDNRLPSTLAHELVHHFVGTSRHFMEGTEFAQTVDDCAPESFKNPYINLMATKVVDAFGASRHHLTVGQAFHMNFGTDNVTYLHDARRPPYTLASPALRPEDQFKCGESPTLSCPAQQYDPGWTQ